MFVDCFSLPVIYMQYFITTRILEMLGRFFKF